MPAMRASGANYRATHESSSSPTPAVQPTTRPELVRRDTDAILSYYQSAHADHNDHDIIGTAPSNPRSSHDPNCRSISSSSASTSSSDYSSESAKESPATSTNPHCLQPRAASPSAVGVRRRTSSPPQRGTDRRRLAVVQVDTPNPSVQDVKKLDTRKSDFGSSRSNSIRYRRGLEARLGDLASVAPPDASHRTNSVLTPPMSAPMSGPQASLSGSYPVSSSSHTRSSSEAVEVSSKEIGHVPRKSSREVAIVGTTGPCGLASDLQHSLRTSAGAEVLKPPLFQIPQSRSPSPGTSEISDSSNSAYRGRRRKDALAPGVSPIKELKEVTAPVRTSDIGESEHISSRTAGAIAINLMPESPSPKPRPSSQQATGQDTMSSPLVPPTTFASTTRSPYLYYQPGVHATAGPLPPPPVAVLNLDPRAPPPPRPPRQSPIRRKGDVDAMKQALQLPPQVTAALKAKSLSPPPDTQGVTSIPSKPSTSMSLVIPSSKDASPESTLSPSIKSDSMANHVREGAFTPSDSGPLAASPEAISIALPHPDSMEDLVASIGNAINDMGIIKANDVPPPTVVEPPRHHEGRNGRQGLEIRREEKRLSVSPQRPHGGSLPSPPSSEESAANSWVDPDKTLTFIEEVLPPLPAKNNVPHLEAKSLKNALNIKRFSSLPRTPSLVSLNRLSTGSKRSSRTPSPSISYPVTRPGPPIRRTRSTCPSAMYFADVVVKKSPLERSIGYAHKINELYNHDCGLGEWVVETRYKVAHPQSSVKRATVNSSGPRVPSTSSPSIAPRHISQSSTDSGVTFPRRADAYSATDLSARTAGDDSPPNAPPPLPYPALATAPRNGPSRASTMIASSSSSSARSIASPPSSKSTGTFFASLGRKTSIKKEKGEPQAPPSPAKVLTKSPPNTDPNPRLMNVQPVTPSVPGGPRAPPNRVQRSQTIAPHTPPTAGSAQRLSTSARRPSLFSSRGSASDHQSEADFNRQVDKLAALLPKADRNILAVYLRHAGQDILAIGQYLEDEKNGNLRRA